MTFPYVHRFLQNLSELRTMLFEIFVYRDFVVKVVLMAVIICSLNCFKFLHLLVTAESRFVINETD